MHPYDFIFAGLAMDIVGAVVLAKGFMLKDAQTAYYEVLMVFGGNMNLLKSALLQRAEARVGAVLLIIGFLLQIWGNLHGGISANDAGWINSTSRMVAVLGLAILVGYLCFFWATRNARMQFYQLFFRNYSDPKQLQDKSNDTAWIDRHSRLLDVKRKRGTSNEQLLKQLEQRWNELGRLYGGQANNFIVNE